MRLIAALLVPLALASVAAAPVVVRDIDGRSWTPLEPAEGQAHILLFAMTDCPISNGYAPEIARIAAEYQRKGIQTFLAYVDPGITTERIRRHLADFYKGAAVRAVNDSSLVLADAVGATITPTATIYTAKGRTYRGRVDDLYVDIGRKRRTPTRHDLRSALEATVAGRPVAYPETQPVGCFLERVSR